MGNLETRAQKNSLSALEIPPGTHQRVTKEHLSPESVNALAELGFKDAMVYRNPNGGLKVTASFNRSGATSEFIQDTGTKVQIEGREMSFTVKRGTPDGAQLTDFEGVDVHHEGRSYSLGAIEEVSGGKVLKVTVKLALFDASETVPNTHRSQSLINAMTELAYGGRD